MQLHGHATVWGIHLGGGRASGTVSWYQQLNDSWTAYKAARREAKRASLCACWDAKREAVTPLRAEAAPEMATAYAAVSVATMLYGLSQ